MTAFVKIADFPLNLGKKRIDLTAVGGIKFALSNTAPASETNNPTAAGNGVLANVTQIAYTNYADDLAADRTLENVAWAHVGGSATLTADDFTISASGGTLAAWRYMYIFDDNAAADDLIALIDREAVVNLLDTETLPIDFGADAGTSGTILTLA